MIYDPSNEAKACINELFYRNGPVAEPLTSADIEYMLEVITRYLSDAFAWGVDV